MMNDKRNNTEDGAIDHHANQQNDSDRMDHPLELREANRLAVNELISGGGTFTPTRLLNIDGTDCTIELVTDSIAQVNVEAIVNAANEMLEGGGGVDQAIHAVAGPNLHAYCVELPYQKVEVEGGAIHKGEMARCPVGEAIPTPGFDLPHANYVIHTVAPLLDDYGQPRSTLLKNCYMNCMKVASELDGCTSIAFCALGTGFYGFPQVDGCEIAINTVYEWLKSSTCTSLKTVKFCMYGSNVEQIYPAVLGKYKYRTESRLK